VPGELTTKLRLTTLALAAVALAACGGKSNHAFAKPSSPGSC
jgi:hypothetical protein